MKNFKLTSFVTIFLFLILVILDTIIAITLFWYALLAIVWFVVMALGSLNMSWHFYLKSFTSQKNTLKKDIAITFDDGPNAEYTLKVLEILNRYQAKATFFCIGEHIETYPEIFKTIVAQGHAVGNHTLSHDIMIDFNSTDQWLHEIKQTDDAISTIINRKTTLFRPPFGVTTPQLAQALKITGHQVIGWSIRSYDTVIKNPERIVKRLTKQLKPGAIILLHDKQANVLPVLEHLLQVLQKHDYRAVTINELLNET